MEDWGLRDCPGAKSVSLGGSWLYEYFKDSYLGI